MKSILITTLLAGLVASPAFAKNPPALFTVLMPSQTAPQQQSTSVSATLDININTALLKPSNIEHTLSVQLPDKTILLEKSRVETHKTAGVNTWIGRIKGSSHSTAVFSEANGIIRGHIDFAGTSYRIEYTNGHYQVRKNDVKNTLPFEETGRAPEPVIESNSIAKSASVASSEDGSRIDVFVYYTKQMQNKYGGGLAALINNYIDITNTAYTNSGIQTKLNLVGTGLYSNTTANEGIDIQTATYAIKDDAEITSTRNDYNADLVALLRVYTGGTFCGYGLYGWTVINNGPRNLSDSWGFSVTDTEPCSDFTFAHEIGHNLGSHHDRAHASSNAGFFPYSHGYDKAGTFATIMSYESPQIAYFSTPLKTHSGLAIGVAEGQTDAADNVKSINNTRGMVSNFRVSNTTPKTINLAVYQTDSADPVTAGADLTYNITVANNGSGDASNVTLVDTLPAGFSAISATDCTVSGNQVTCPLSVILAGSSITRAIVGKPSTPGIISNTVSVSSSETDSNPANNTNTETTNVVSTTSYTLSVSTTGTGIGQISSNPSGIDCGTDCSEIFGQNSQINLTAAPDVNSTFTGWSGSGCSGIGSCTVTMDAAKSVTATFTLKLVGPLLTVTKAGNGTGKVTSTPTGIDCGTACSTTYLKKTIVTLSATPNADSTFGGWTGGCSGAATTCKVTMTAAKSVTATFKKIPYYLLSVTLPTGKGTGKVTSSPAGIDCGADCSESYINKTVVTLTAIPDSNSTFFGWSGSCSGKATCKVTMTAAKNVTATFAVKPIVLSSSAFANNKAIPKLYTCDGDNVSPPLAWTNIPTGTQSLALIVDDPDAPNAQKMWVHWVAYNFPSDTASLAAAGLLPEGTVEGINDFENVGYGGPCPPQGKAHRYFHKLYALDTVLSPSATAPITKAQLEQAMQGHIKGQATLIGTYKRSLAQ